MVVALLYYEVHCEFESVCFLGTPDAVQSLCYLVPVASQPQGLVGLFRGPVYADAQLCQVRHYVRYLGVELVKHQSVGQYRISEIVPRRRGAHEVPVHV